MLPAGIRPKHSHAAVTSSLANKWRHEPCVGAACVDCGLNTGRFCDHCFAKDRIPSEEWAPNQLTPLCSKCESRWDACRFCRGVSSCTPPSFGPK